MSEYICWGIVLAAFLISVPSAWAAYRNGVNDGWGAAKDPRNPGYHKAVRILQHLGKIPDEG